mgnify:CR=1 FL=1
MNVRRRRSDHEMRARGIGTVLGYFIGGNRGGGFVGNVSTQGGVAVDRLGDSLSKLTAGNNSTRSANEKSQREVVINMEASGEDISKVVPQRAKKVKTGLQSQPYSGGHEKNTKIYQNWVPQKKILTTNLWSSELSKLVSNAFLAQRVSSINSISALCEATGANVKEVSNAVGLDSRIGREFLNSGPGFGGSCFKKDILNLVYLCRYYGLNEVSDYWEQIVKINVWQQKRISLLVIKNLFGTLSNKRLAIFGFAFKANTNDTRESPAIYICKKLIEEGAILNIYDPKVKFQQMSKDLKNNDSEINNDKKWHYSNEVYDTFIDADAAIFLTEWDEFLNLNWQKISKAMRQPAFIFDTRSIVNIQEVKESNLKIWQVGYGHQL